MQSITTFNVIIPAAGIGSRMAASTAKQYILIGQQTILEHTLSVFLSHSRINKVVVVLHPQDELFATLSIAKHPRLSTVIGGSERADSVLAGLSFVAKTELNHHFVLIHDAARPCVNTDDITRLIERCALLNADDEVCGAILACPVTDTIKRASPTKQSRADIQEWAQEQVQESPQEQAEESAQANVLINNTVDRSMLWQAQTPQMFRIGELIAAIKAGLANGYTLSDEASAMELTAKKVVLVEGPSSNIKITKPSDVSLASFYLNPSNKVS